MDQEAIEHRLGELQQERAKAVAHINALDGAIMELRYWLSKLQEDEES